MSFKFKTSKKEICDLLEAWIFISLAFGIVLADGKLFSLTTLKSFFLAALTVGTGFLFHEMGHKLMAQKYGCFAEFRASIKMLVLALLMSFFGFVFAAPGAVMIAGRVTGEQRGKISIAGPIVNIVLALFFSVIVFVSSKGSILFEIAAYGVWVNSFLAVFNMLPFSILDGRKVLEWNRKAYSAVMVPAVFLMFFATQYLPL
ncbi:MAG: hypothetical protein ABIC91_07760 [Nanoarchaeota archaeon]|nr:hypothetical protein [Nanoarchaeota archaeon]MBU1031247.1 hypothetical protein [Nanoarchaeota archaeon]MBU1849588.1 hypothetical protein [Nanoarchaeota archaeon]